MSIEIKVRKEFGVPAEHSVEEIEGWWSEVNAVIRVWIHRDETGEELLRYKLEHFPGDIEMWSVVDSSWGNK